MKQCISSLIARIKHLWQTLKEYVCKMLCRDRHLHTEIDIDGDGTPEITIDAMLGNSHDPDNLNKEDTNYGKEI